MSGNATSLPNELNELMTQTVIWEAFLGNDGYGQPSFDTPQTLSCWAEPRSQSSGEGYDADRGGTDWVFVPTFSLLFTGDGVANTFTLNDRFTCTYNGGAMVTQPTAITPMYGPPFDNRNPWLIQVFLGE